MRFFMRNHIFDKLFNLTQITAIIPTFNEESNIERALNSVSFADEIIIIDSFSSDATLAIAKENSKVKIIQRQFDDFSSQKNYAIHNAKYNWIVVLDADEEISEELKQEIVEKVNKPANFSAFYIYRNFFFKNDKLNFTISPKRDKVIRLFKKTENEYKGKVHEVIVSSGKVGFLKHKINHYSYRCYHQYKGKIKKYAKLQAQELFENGIFVTPYHLIIKPIIRFMIHFILKLGFLDGVKGLKISFIHSYGVFQRYVEVVKLKKNVTSNEK